MNSVILGFLVLNVLFWSFFPHNAHCNLIASLNKTLKTNIKCQSHSIHLFMGIIFYLITLYYSQSDYIHQELF